MKQSGPSRDSLPPSWTALASTLPSILRLPSRVLVGLIRVYQLTLSPALPILTIGACGCRFAPTCSHYALEAVQAHGAARGTWLAMRRLLKCTPLHPGGFDPVPMAAHSGPASRPTCLRVPS